jgi:hypothetical protein
VVILSDDFWLLIFWLTGFNRNASSSQAAARPVHEAAAYPEHEAAAHPVDDDNIELPDEVEDDEDDE